MKDRRWDRILIDSKASSGLTEAGNKLSRPSRFVFHSSMYVANRGAVGVSGYPAG